MILTERPKGMRRKDWAQLLVDQERATAPQLYIIWFYRGQALQWVKAPDYASGVMKGCQPIIDDLSLFIWHAALVEAMHWAYNPEEDPPKGWLRATPENLLDLELIDD